MLHLSHLHSPADAGVPVRCARPRWETSPTGAAAATLDGCATAPAGASPLGRKGELTNDARESYSGATPALIFPGAAAFGGYTGDAPGTRRLIRCSDLPAPYNTSSASNGPSIVSRPAGALPQARNCC